MGKIKEIYKSKVYTERPDYADFDAPAKFIAIQSIVAKRLREHPNAICSYSGGADSDIMIDVIERTREVFSLPPIKYVFFNTGLEMKAIKDHVKETAKNMELRLKNADRKSISLLHPEHMEFHSYQKSCLPDYQIGKRRTFHCRLQRNTSRQKINQRSGKS